MNSSTFDCVFWAIIGFAWGVMFYLFIEYRNGRRFSQQDLRKAIRAGYLDGLNNGTIFGAAIARKHAKWEAQGFAEACRKCGCIHSIINDLTEEYWTCTECSHRQPCPEYKAKPVGSSIK